MDLKLGEIGEAENESVEKESVGEQGIVKRLNVTR